MTKLEEARKNINEIDAEIAKLFEKRMMAVEEVIAYKIENNLPIFDESREKEVLKRNVEKLNNEKLRVYYEEYLQMMMDISKKYQKAILNEKKE